MFGNWSGHVVEIFGAPHYYDVAGAGHPLVLIHEGIADSRMFDGQVAPFAERYRVVRYDVSGFGRSGIPTTAFTNHEVLRELLRHLDVDRAHLLGMSMGGGVALDFTLTYPEMVTGLVLAASSVGGGRQSEPVQQQWAAIAAAMEAGDASGAVELGLRMWVDGQRPGGGADQSVRERVREMMAHNFALPEVEPKPLDPPAMARLGEIRAPTLVIVGDADVPDIVEQADVLSRRIAGAAKVVIPDAAHALNMERPEEFNRLVLDFLGSVGK